MRVKSPRSTSGRSASCWDRLKRWISSRMRSVFCPFIDRRSFGPVDHRPDIGDPGGDGVHLLNRRLGFPRDQPRQGGLPAAGRPEKNSRTQAVGFHGAAEKLSFAEQMVLPGPFIEREGDMRSARGASAAWERDGALNRDRVVEEVLRAIKIPRGAVCSDRFEALVSGGSVPAIAKGDREG